MPNAHDGTAQVGKLARPRKQRLARWRALAQAGENAKQKLSLLTQDATKFRDGVGVARCELRESPTTSP
jgi:hypothetical protein